MEHFPQFSRLAKLWDRTEEHVHFFGSGNASGVLRFTYKNEIAGHMSDLLETYSEKLNLRLEHYRFGGSNEKNMDQNKFDFSWYSLILSSYNITGHKRTPIIDDYYAIKFFQKMFTRGNEVERLLDAFDFKIWILLFISLILTAKFLVVAEKNKSIFNLAGYWFLSLYGILLGVSASRLSVAKFNLALWLLLSLIINNTLKSLVRDRLIFPKTWWYETPEQLAEAPDNYKIWVRHDYIMLDAIKRRAREDPNGAFDKLYRRSKLLVASEFRTNLLGFLTELRDCRAGMFWPEQEERIIHGFLGEFQKSKAYSYDEIKFDKMNLVNLIRKNYEFGDSLIVITQRWIEAGFGGYWERLERFLVAIAVLSFQPDLLDFLSLEERSFVIAMSDVKTVVIWTIIFLFFSFIAFLFEVVYQSASIAFKLALSKLLAVKRVNKL